MRRIFEQLIPFIVIGIGIVVILFSAILFFYLFLFGTIVGAILFLIAWIKQKFFMPHLPAKKDQKSAKTGRVIDSDDWNRL
jgi:hypothetical protein